MWSNPTVLSVVAILMSLIVGFLGGMLFSQKYQRQRDYEGYLARGKDAASIFMTAKLMNETIDKADIMSLNFHELFNLFSQYWEFSVLRCHMMDVLGSVQKDLKIS